MTQISSVSFSEQVTTCRSGQVFYERGEPLQVYATASGAVDVCLRVSAGPRNVGGLASHATWYGQGPKQGSFRAGYQHFREGGGVYARILQGILLFLKSMSFFVSHHF